MIKFKRLTIALAALLITSATAWADEAKVYTEAVAFNSLEAGDVLTDGFSITKNIGDYIKVKGYKKDSGTAETEGYSDLLNDCTYPGGVVITVSGYGISGNYTPYADGKDANAWIVSKKEVNGSYTALYLDGYNYLPAIDLTEVTPGKQWQIAAMPAGNVTLNVEYEPELTATFKALTANTIQGGKATVTLTDNTQGAQPQPQTLDADGKLTPVYEGQTITLTAATGYKFRKVEAKKGEAAVKVTAITLNKTETSIKVGATETLSVTSVLPEEATDKTYTWKTSDASKATVDQDGKVTAVAEGTVTIYAEANDGSGVKGNCTVTVTPATITVTIKQSDWGSDWNPSFTKDGVTVSAGMIDPMDGNLLGGGTFSTTLGNFTKIVVTTFMCDVSGTGWSGSDSSKTWTGTPASTVSFSGDFMGRGQTQTTIVCTIVPKN